MIHIVTVHFGSLDWIPVQHAYIKANVSQFKMWYFIDDVEFEPWPFDFAVRHKSQSEIRYDHIGKDHAEKLDKMTNELLANEPDDDVVLFLDGDSFPIRPIDKLIDEALADNDFFAIVREEIDKPFPHPSFACCKLGFWRKHNLSWGICGEDTGNCLLEYFNTHNIKWKKVLRSHSLCSSKEESTNKAWKAHLKEYPQHARWRWYRNARPLFGVYGGFVYHHGAAFRPKYPFRPHAAIIFDKIKEIGTNFVETFMSPSFEPYTEEGLLEAHLRREPL